MRKYFAALVLVAVLPAFSARAEQKPLWEAGLGIGALSFPDYRGSNESQIYPVPVPYFIYRGKILKADRDGVRGELFNKKYAELNMSVGATIPVKSDNNAARTGMPDLQPTIELGPSLDLHLWRSANAGIKLDVVMPLRVPLTIESSPQSIGWVFSPRLNLDLNDVAGHPGWNFGFGVGPIYADRKFHDYFYSVAPQFATADRPAFSAHGGYSGVHFLTALSKRFPKYWVGAYMRYDNLSGAAFEDSALVKSKSYWAGGFGIAWMIGESKQMVETED
ncbi:MAG TPA: MipA/OmpV family protein [Steroidobacteraceae bacterium]